MPFLTVVSFSSVLYLSAYLISNKYLAIIFSRPDKHGHADINIDQDHAKNNSKFVSKPRASSVGELKLFLKSLSETIINFIILNVYICIFRNLSMDLFELVINLVAMVNLFD